MENGPFIDDFMRIYPLNIVFFSIVILVTRGYRKSNDPPIIPHSKSWLPNVANGSAVGLVGGMSEQVSQCRIGTSEHTKIYNYTHTHIYIYNIIYIAIDRLQLAMTQSLDLAGIPPDLLITCWTAVPHFKALPQSTTDWACVGMGAGTQLQWLQTSKACW